MTEEDTDQVEVDNPKLDSTRSREVPAESSEIARAYWSSVKEDQAKRDKEKRAAQAKIKADETLAEKQRISERAQAACDRSAATAGRMRTHTVLHRPSNKR